MKIVKIEPAGKEMYRLTARGHTDVLWVGVTLRTHNHCVSCGRVQSPRTRCFKMAHHSSRDRLCSFCIHDALADNDFPPIVYRVANIHLLGNEHGQLKSNVIYAELLDNEGEVSISATLDHILTAIRDRKLTVVNADVTWEKARGAICSKVELTP